MNNIFKQNSLKKWLIVYLSLILGGYFLFSAVWGGVNGLMVAGRIAIEPGFDKEIMKIMGTQPQEKDFWEKLPQQTKNEIKALLKQRFRQINWLPVHLIVNVLTFSVLGFIAGYLLKNFAFSGIIPLTLSFEALPVLNCPDFMVTSRATTHIIGISAQIASVYLFSYLGYRLKERKIAKKATENTTSPNNSVHTDAE